MTLESIDLIWKLINDAAPPAPSGTVGASAAPDAFKAAGLAPSAKAADTPPSVAVPKKTPQIASPPASGKKGEREPTVPIENKAS